MPTPYDDDGLAAELRRLPHWSGDISRISRTVLLPTDLDAELRRRIAAVAKEVNHHPVLAAVPGGTRYVLWTHVRDAVTELDIDLAHRIDDLVQGP